MIKTRIKGIDMTFETNEKVFSPKNVDGGTLAMLSVVDFIETDKVLDLGCGYGVVGILAAKIIGAKHIFMLDVNSEAVSLSKRNALMNAVGEVNVIESDNFRNLDEKDFTVILSNPPYHADFSVPKSFIEKGFNRLSIGGRMYMVTKRKEWYKNKLESIFGGVKIWEINGYYVFMSIKKTNTYAKVKKQ